MLQGNSSCEHHLLSVLIVFVLTLSFSTDAQCTTSYPYPAYFSFSGQHPDPCDLRDVGVPAAEARAPARAPAQLPPLHPGLGPRRPRHPALHPLRVQVSTSNNYRISNHETSLQV